MEARRMTFLALLAASLVVVALPAPGHAEVEKAVIQILGGMQCSL
jgi:hypothetical protein